MIRRDIIGNLDIIFLNYKKFYIYLYRLEIELSDLWYELENVKAVDYSKERTSFNQDLATERYYKISDQIQEKEKDIRFMKAILDGMKQFWELIPDPEIRDKIGKEKIDYQFIDRMRKRDGFI